MAASRKRSAGSLLITEDDTGELQMEAREPVGREHGKVILDLHINGELHTMSLSRTEMEALFDYLGDVIADDLEDEDDLDDEDDEFFDDEDEEEQ